MHESDFHAVGTRSVALLALIVALAATAPSFAQTCEPAQPCGDVDDSGTVNTTDALKVLKNAVGQPQVLTCQCSLGTGDTCEEELATATANLETCTGNLESCTSDLAGCDGDLDTCQGSLEGCDEELGACQNEPRCGNNVLEEGEDCEVAVISLETCASIGGFAGGTLRCGVGCSFDTGECYVNRFDSTGLTILDRETGLQWEKKDSSDNTQDPGNPHDVDNVYSWSGSGVIVFSSTRGVTSTPADGTMFVDFLSKLNGSEDGEGYAGHTDWRIPSLVELESITVVSPDCNFSPCVPGEDFLPNRSAVYWTNTTDSMVPGFAYSIDYADGDTAAGVKTGLAFVRAVRTGLDTGN